MLRALGERPVAAGFLGGDRGEQLRADLEARGIELDFVKVAARTRQCTTLLDTSAGTQTELVEESQPVAATDYEELMRVIRRRVRGCGGRCPGACAPRDAPGEAGGGEAKPVGTGGNSGA